MRRRRVINKLHVQRYMYTIFFCNAHLVFYENELYDNADTAAANLRSHQTPHIMICRRTCTRTNVQHTLCVQSYWMKIAVTRITAFSSSFSTVYTQTTNVYLYRWPYRLCTICTSVRIHAPINIYFWIEMNYASRESCNPGHFRLKIRNSVTMSVVVRWTTKWDWLRREKMSIFGLNETSGWMRWISFFFPNFSPFFVFCLFF